MQVIFWFHQTKIFIIKFLKLLKTSFKMIPQKAQEILDFWFKETPDRKKV